MSAIKNDWVTKANLPPEITKEIRELIEVNDHGAAYKVAPP